MIHNEIKQLINDEFNKLNKFEQNKLLRRIALARTNYHHFINGDKLGKLGKEKSINVTTFFALCNELGITLSAHKELK